MTDKKKTVAEDPEVVIETAIGKTELFIEKNSRTLLTVLGAVILVVLGFFAYKYLYAHPRQEKASAAMYQAQNLFAVDSFALALNGNADIDGFLQVIDNYGSTASGNLAKHYAGQCYLRIGDYANAVKYFSMYSDVKGLPSQIINAVNAGLLGDAYVQSGDTDKGLAQYEKAVAKSDNMLTAAYYLRKAAQVYEKKGDFAKALEAYKNIRNKYPQSMEARDMDKHIAEMEQKI